MAKEVKCSKNENGDPVIIVKYTNRVEVKTYQKNNWVRVNIYYNDGMKEEIYEK